MMTTFSESHIQKFRDIVGDENIIISKEIPVAYHSDATENLSTQPEILLKPLKVEQISKILHYCNQNKIPVVPRAGGTGLMGGALVGKGAILLSVEKLNRILNIDVENHQITVEAGVINYALQKELEVYGLFFPPDPSSWQSSFIGGNIATNAGGPRAVKYGVTSNYVLNLEVVLPNGDIIWTGANTLKNVTGYNLTQLFIGSEGTLGIVTKAVLKVIPKPKKEISLLVPFFYLKDSCHAINNIFNAGFNPSTLELMEREALKVSFDNNEDSSVPFDKEIHAHLLISFDGNQEEELLTQAEEIIHLLDEKYALGEVLIASTKKELDKVWQLRRTVAEVVKRIGYTIEEDTVVPRNSLAELVEFVHQLAKKHNMKAVCYGHAGDGNLHIRFNHPVHKSSYQNKEMQNIISELFYKVKDLGGTISAEHGIGLIQKPYLPIVLSDVNLSIQKAIKRLLDPNGIMNPGKIFDL